MHVCRLKTARREILSHRVARVGRVRRASADRVREKSINTLRGTSASWYEPYGEVTSTGSSNSNNPYQYTGRENDGTGLYYYRARYYSPTLKRFISEDPIGLGGGLNEYAYARGNPMSFIDPSGTDVAVIENGATSGNPFGHTAIAVTGAGVYSFGNDTPPGSDLTAYLTREATRRDTTVYVIPTDGAEDAAVLAKLQSYGTSKPGILSDSCADRSNKALDILGITPGFPEDLPGVAGLRALANGTPDVYTILQGSTGIPWQLSGFDTWGPPAQ